MKRNEYLRLSFSNGAHLFTEWWVRVLSEFVDPPGKPAPTEPYFLVKQPWGYGIIMPGGKIEPLDDTPLTEAAFQINDAVSVDPSWMKNIQMPMKSTLGIAGANAILLAEVFGKKIPYINGEVSIVDIEAIVAKKLTSNPPDISRADTSDPSKIYVFEYLKLGQGIELIASIMELFTIGLTRKTLLPPPGIDKYKEELLASPDFDVNDPLQLADFEKKLLKFDAEYLKDDPSYGKFASGKILKDSRKKLFLSLGAEGGFRKDGGITGITTTLSDGLPMKPEEFVAVANGSRAGSFSRGFETQEGGVAAKKMLAATNNYVISEGDCGVGLGITRLYTPWLAKSLRGRTIINGKTQTKVAVDADVGAYIGKLIKTRSPAYCLRKGENICAACSGDSMARYRKGIALPLTEISHAILTARMKAMHTNSLTVNDFDLDTLFT